MPSTRPLLPLLITLLVACRADTPVRPAGPPSGPAPLVRAYLDEVVTRMQERALYRRWIDWTRVRQVVIDAAGSAQRISDALPAVRAAIALLGDGRTTYVPRTGPAISLPAFTCSAPSRSTPVVPADIGYVRVAALTATGDAARTRAAELQAMIRAQDRSDLTGWIVDLRGTADGNMWSMLGGLGPLLGDGDVGFFVDLDGVAVAWSYRGGTVRRGGVPMLDVPNPYQLQTPGGRVAVLIDNAVADAGEAVAIAFRSRPSTRVFGNATCGRSIATDDIALSDGATLQLAVSVMADRSGRPYGDRVQPDEPFIEDGPTVARAIEWLRRER